MIKKIKEIYKPEYMTRPLVYKCYSKVIFSMVLCLAWNRFVNDGSRGIDVVFTVAAVFFLAMCWFNYLKMDNVRIGHLMEGWKQKKKKTPHWNKDIADFVDEEVIDYNELDEDEKDVIKLLSNLIVGLIYLVLTIITTVL